MDSFLAEALERMNKLPTGQMIELREQFDRSMAVNHSLFKHHAFRKSLAGSPEGNRSVLNIALFDVCSVLISRVDPATVISRSEAIKEVIRGLTRDEGFSHSITYSTNSRKQVEERFAEMEQRLGEVLR
jgi:hypothetical protein